MNFFLAFQLWLACAIFYLPMSRQAFLRVAPWEIEDSYHTYQYSQSSDKFFSKIFDPSTVPVNPSSSSSKILGVDPATKPKSKGLKSFFKSTKTKGNAGEETKGKAVEVTPAAKPGSLDKYLQPLRGSRAHQEQFEQYFKDTSYSHQIVAAVLSTGKFKRLEQFAQAQFSLGQYTPDIIQTAFDSYLLYQKSITRLEYYAWLHLFALATSGEGKPNDVIQIQLAVKTGLAKLLAQFRQDPVKLEVPDTLAQDLTAKDVLQSTEALQAVIMKRWNKADVTLKQGIQTSLAEHPEFFRESSRKFVITLFAPGAVESVGDGRAPRPNEFNIFVGGFSSKSEVSQAEQRKLYLQYIDPNRETPFIAEIVQKAMQINNFKLLQDFARAQFATRGFTPDLIRTAFDNHILSKDSIGRVEYIAWFHLFATAVFGKSSEGYRLQAEAALQGGLTSLLEKFRLHPETLKLEDPLAVDLHPQNVIDSAIALKSVISDRWRNGDQVLKEAIKEIPFAREINLPQQGLGKHLGDIPEFKKLVSFDQKLSALVAKSTSITEEGDEILLVKALVNMANPTAQNSIQTKTAAVVFLHYLASSKEETIPRKLKSLAQVQERELLQRGRRDEQNIPLENPLILAHDQVLLQVLNSPNPRH